MDVQINMKGLDGIQGPMYVGTGCCFNRRALYGYDPVLTEADLEPNIIFKSLCGGSRKRRGTLDIKKGTEAELPLYEVEDEEEDFDGKLQLFPVEALSDELCIFNICT